MKKWHVQNLHIPLGKAQWKGRLMSKLMDKVFRVSAPERGRNGIMCTGLFGGLCTGNRQTGMAR